MARGIGQPLVSVTPFPRPDSDPKGVRRVNASMVRLKDEFGGRHVRVHYFHLLACRRSSRAGIQSAIQGEWVFTRR